MSDINELVTEEQYLVQEPQREYKSEFLQGRVVAMSGASTNHVRIGGNLYFSFRQSLQGKPCEAFVNDLKIKVAAAAFYTYPDLAIVCGPPEFDRKDIGALLNPTVLFEVLSPSTEAYDRGEKFGYYKRLSSLRDYVLVSQNRIKVEHFTLQDSGDWALAVLTSGDSVLQIASLDCEVTLRDIYVNVKFDV